MSIALLLILVTTAATLGNSVGYAIGRWGGRAALDKLKAAGRWARLAAELDTIEAEAARLRAAAEARPLKLPVNRRVDESHHLVTDDGLSVWYTIQVSPHSRIQEALFERSDRMPGDEECNRWLALLVTGGEAVEAPSMPGSMTRRFELFERDPEREAPLA